MTWYENSVPRWFRKLQEETPQDPEWWYQQKANAPWPFDSLYDWQINKALYKDARRYDEDLYRNTGQSWRNSPYPWLSYQQSASGRHQYGSSDGFEATKSVISLYSKWWK